MTGPAEPGSAIATESARVRLHPLRTRADRGSWVIGRADTGRFITVPEIGYRAVTLLAEGGSVDEVRTRLRRETGRDVDIADFVGSLVELGFVSELDGRSLRRPPARPPTFAWLRPAHVRWLLHPAVGWLAGATVLAAIVAMLIDPSLTPRYRDLLWSGSGGAVVLGNAAIGWTLLFLHELAHLATARAAGVPGWMSLGTRLQFLVAQTDVSGVWAERRRVRLTVYLAGIGLNLVVFAGCVLSRLALDATGLGYGLLAAAGLISLTFIPFQFLVFMRTDLYFVLQDLTGSADLYADGSAYARYRATRWWRRRGHGDPPSDPSLRLPGPERIAVRAYTYLLVIGTCACLAVAAMVTVPVTGTLLAQAASRVVGASSAAELFDAVAVLATGALFFGLWTRGWWRRHRDRVRRLLGHRPRVRERR